MESVLKWWGCVIIRRVLRDKIELQTSFSLLTNFAKACILSTLISKPVETLPPQWPLEDVHLHDQGFI